MNQSDLIRGVQDVATGLANGTGGHQVNALKLISMVAYKTILPMICAFGILGNILNLLTLRSPALQAVSYMYLRALAVADLLCMVFVMLFVCRIAKVITLKGYYIHYYAAHLELPIINFFIASGVLTIVALTIDRYVSVVWPLKFSAWNTTSKAYAFIFGAYLTCFLLYLPMCWQKHVHIKYANCTITDRRLNIANSTCGIPQYHVRDDPKSKHGGFVAYKWIRECLLRLVPILALTYLNIHIIVKLRIVAKNRARMAGGKQRQQQRVPIAKASGESSYAEHVQKKASQVGVTAGGSMRSERNAPTQHNQEKRASRQGRDDQRLLLLLSVIVVLFFICNLPAAVNLIFITDDFAKNIVYQIFRATANVLEIANHAVNFYIFCCCSKDYRQEFLRTLKTFPCAFYIRRLFTLATQNLNNHCYHWCWNRVHHKPSSTDLVCGAAELDGTSCMEQKALIPHAVPRPSDPSLTITTVPTTPAAGPLHPMTSSKPPPLPSAQTVNGPSRIGNSHEQQPDSSQIQTRSSSLTSGVRKGSKVDVEPPPRPLPSAPPDPATPIKCSENCGLLNCTDGVKDDGLRFSDFKLDNLPETIITNGPRLAEDDCDEIFV